MLLQLLLLLKGRHWVEWLGEAQGVRVFIDLLKSFPGSFHGSMQPCMSDGKHMHA